MTWRAAGETSLLDKGAFIGSFLSYGLVVTSTHVKVKHTENFDKISRSRKKEEPQNDKMRNGALLLTAVNGVWRQ